jgi:exonuclease SbcD
MSDTRIMFVGDVHAADTPPAKRTHTYRQDILDKLVEIVEIANTYPVDYVLFAGDIFHHKQPRSVSHKLVLDLMAIFQQFKMPVYIVVGNHDITEGRLESLEKQPLGVLGNLPNVHLLLWEPAILGNVAIYPIPGVPGVTTDAYNINEIDGAKYHAIASHQSIVPDKSKLPPFLSDKDFIHDSSEVAEITSARVIFYGHEHGCHGIYKRNGKAFINLGSICRGTISQDDVEKEPQVAIIIFDNGVTADRIKLKSVKPAEEVFLLEQHFEQKEHQQDIQDAISRLKNTKLERFSIEAIMQEVESREDIEEKTRTVALDLLENVK